MEKTKETERMSKVAYCPVCGGFTMACHIDYLDYATESDFNEALKAGFSIKIETAAETRAREWIKFSECSTNHLLTSQPPQDE